MYIFEKKRGKILKLNRINAYLFILTFQPWCKNPFPFIFFLTELSTTTLEIPSLKLTRNEHKIDVKFQNKKLFHQAITHHVFDPIHFFFYKNKIQA